MSTLISSAVGGGKWTAPKAVARRRPPPRTAEPPVHEEITTTACAQTEDVSATTDIQLLSPQRLTDELSDRPPAVHLAEPPLNLTSDQRHTPEIIDNERPADSPVELSATTNKDVRPATLKRRWGEREQDATGASGRLATLPRSLRDSETSISATNSDERLEEQRQVESGTSSTRRPINSTATRTSARTRKKQRAQLSETEQTAAGILGETQNSSNVSNGRRKRRRGRTSHVDDDENDSQTVAGTETENATVAGDSTDPELHQIDPKSLTMFDLSYDRRHGRLSEREKKMSLIQWDEVARKRKAADNLPAAERLAAIKEARTLRNSNAGNQPTESQTSDGVQFRIVDGQIVVDEGTTLIDRQAQAELEVQMEQPVEEETDLTTPINRTTWINDRRRDISDRVPLYKRKSDPWSFEETERLYQAISMFGTDYFTIAQMFPPKTRRQIKLKVQREEKIDPARVNAALMGRQAPMSLESYAEATGRDVSDFTRHGTLEEASSRIAVDMKDKEEAMRAALATEAENERQREAFEREQARARKNAAEKKRKKPKGGGTMGGVPLDQDDDI